MGLYFPRQPLLEYDLMLQQTNITQSDFYDILIDRLFSQI